MQVTQETFEMAILAAPVVVVGLAGLAVVFFAFLKWKTALVMAFLALLVNGCTEQIPLRFSPELPDAKPVGTLRILEYNICGKGSESSATFSRLRQESRCRPLVSA